MDVTAVILSSKPVTTTIPGVAVVSHVSTFSDAAGLLNARIAALDKVLTERFFFLDDDDVLPDNYLDVLERCIDTGAAVAYTNELIRLEDGTERVRKSGPYSQSAHFSDFMLIHHLAVCRTDAARRAAAVIPRGTYGAESLLFFQAAKEGAQWVDEIGYVWVPKKTGLSNHPSLLIGHIQSATWASRNRA